MTDRSRARPAAAFDGTPPSSFQWVAAAARNNAEWCDAVCRAQGLAPTFGEQFWSCPQRTPRFYPDAVTLTAEVDAIELLNAVDRRSPGCSVKDSFARLDLSRFGFEVLFEAEWLLLRNPPTSQPPPSWRWEAVRDAGFLREWERAWSGGVEGDALFRPALLEDPSITFLGAREADRYVAGAVLQRSADELGVVGVSNVFGPEAESRRLWSALVEALPRFGVTGPAVGYEWGPALNAARGAGFEPIGPLRVWVSKSDG